MKKKEMYLTWKEPLKRKRYVVGVLTYQKDKYNFKYGYEIKGAIEEGFSLLREFTDVEKNYESEKLFFSFRSRIPSRVRGDFKEFLEKRELTIETTDFLLLKETRGILPTDTLEFLEVMPSIDEKNFEFEFYLVGTKYYCKEKKEILNVRIERDLENKCDKYAIVLLDYNDTPPTKIGYVPNCYCKELSELVEKNILNVEVTKTIWDEGFYPEIKIKISKKI